MERAEQDPVTPLLTQLMTLRFGQRREGDAAL